MAEFPALPIWTDAYLADTAHLSYAEHGLYLNILMAMWRTPGCQMPNDVQWIDKRFNGNAISVLAICEEFCTLSDDKRWWFQKRLRKQWEWCKQKSIQNAEKANQRWNKEKDPYNGNANAMLLNLNPNPKRKEGNGGIFEERKKGEIREGFKAKPGSKEFDAWKAHYKKLSHAAMLRELSARELEGRSYDFPCQWPPEH